MSEDDSRTPAILTASVTDVRYLASLLRGVHFTTMASVTIGSAGLTIVVEDARTIVGYAFIFAQIFDEYELHLPPNPAAARPPKSNTRKPKSEPASDSQILADNSETEDEPDSDADPGAKEEDEEQQIAFQINLNILVDCLNIFGTAGALPASNAATNFKRWKREGEDDEQDGARGRLDAYLAGGSEKRTSMRMSYVGEGYPLTLLIAEDASGPTTTCEITTYESESHINLEFDPSATVLKIILKSSWLRDALSELDPSCEKLTFVASPPAEPTNRNGPQRSRANAQPMFRIQADGTHGSTEMDYPNDREVLETFECTGPVSVTYRFSHIVRTLRALSSSTKTSLRIDESGLLSLQFLMPKPHGDGQDGFVEFRCLALDD